MNGVTRARASWSHRTLKGLGRRVSADKHHHLHFSSQYVSVERTKFDPSQCRRPLVHTKDMPWKFNIHDYYRKMQLPSEKFSCGSVLSFILISPAYQSITSSGGSKSVSVMSYSMAQEEVKFFSSNFSEVMKDFSTRTQQSPSERKVLGPAPGCFWIVPLAHLSFLPCDSDFWLGKGTDCYMVSAFKVTLK